MADKGKPQDSSHDGNHDHNKDHEHDDELAAHVSIEVMTEDAKTAVIIGDNNDNLKRKTLMCLDPENSG